MSRHELASELKTAGFPQNVVCQHYELECCEHDKYADSGGFRNDEPYHPTLSELIEACGDEFESLKKGYDSKWLATGLSEDGERMNFYGKTPSEAVAKLWLALNKHE